MRTERVTPLRQQSTLSTPSPSRELTLPTGDPNRPVGSWGATAARYIFGHYPAPNVLDVPLFLRTAGRALADYPAWVVVELVNEKTGIIAQKPWAPRINELIAFCDARIRDRQLQEHRSRCDEEMARERRREEAHAAENARVEGIVQAAMLRLEGHVMYLGSPVPGMPRYQARYRWEKAMVRENPAEDLNDIVDVLNANKDLVEAATEAEMKKAGTGWTTILPAVLRLRVTNR
jgi:hypothetical protein